MLKPAISPYPQRRGDRALWFWMDLAVFWLALSGIFHALLVSVYDFSQPLTVLLGTGAGLLLSVLVCYNKYTVALAALAPLAALAALFAAMGSSRPLCRWAMEFFPWVGNNMFYTDADKTSVYFVPCVLVTLAVLSLVLYILAFQLRAMLGCLSGGAALCITLYFTFDTYYIGHRSDKQQVLFCLCVLLCCSLYYLARRQHARATRRLSFPRSFVPFQRFFLPFFLIAALATGMFAPAVLGNMRSDAWIDAVDWALNQGIPNGFLDLEFTNFYGKNKDLGGDVDLSSDPLFTVASSAPLHLRGVVYDCYDGRGWSDTLSGKGEAVLETEPASAHDHGTMTKGLYPQYFSLDQPYIQANYEFGREGNTDYPLRARTFTIKDSKLYTRTIFSAPFTKRATFLTSRNQVRINGSSALFSNRRLRGKEDSYTVSYLEPVAGTFDFYLRDSRGLTPKAEYLQLPESLPESVRALSVMLTAGYSNPYAACTKISEYLTRNQTYTTHPGDVPAGKDFVDYFLFENKRGYCVYYATAMVVLARASGYPARYVEGYRVDNYDAGRGLVVTGQNAHAWAEVYLDGVGWMTFDPVAANQFATNMHTVITSRPASSSPASVESQGPVEPSSQWEPPSVESQPSSQGESAPVGFLAAIVTICLLAAAVLCLMITRYAIYRTRWRQRLDSGPPPKAIPLYRELERALRRCRYPKPINETVRAYLTSLEPEFQRLERETTGRRESEETRDYAALCESAVNAVYAEAYSQRPAPEEDRRALLTLTVIAEQRVRKQMGAVLFALWWKQF